ncbi:hypothetical protein CK203_083473 [Vitis vinifera]|uniref:DUF7895 domain-containing protein n=1 Tax=Vitis vinifera TaxID=29760 RepID=A0A438C3M6_VITVI|nr:hypothetical protein CK203_083473 [Vitis vinifera]
MLGWRSCGSILILQDKAVEEGKEDKVCWVETKSETFSVKSLHASLKIGRVVQFPSSVVWNVWVPRSAYWHKNASMELRTESKLLVAGESRDFKPHIHNAFDPDPISLTDVKLQAQRRKICRVSYALPETAASVAIAATVVGAAATLLVRRSRPSEATEETDSFKICEDCGGSGICSECNGEGFVLKKLSEASAEKARLTAKNMATRYTAGLPKKWSYCTKCSSARSCSTCGGSGKLSS